MTEQLYNKKAPSYDGAVIKQKAPSYDGALNDVSDKIRTRDLLVRSQTLYPAELHLHSNNILYNESAFVNNNLR